MRRKIKERGRRVPKPGEKINIGVLIDSELWQRFKVHCLEQNRGEGELLNQLIREYLEKL